MKRKAFQKLFSCCGCQPRHPRRHAVMHCFRSKSVTLVIFGIAIALHVWSKQASANGKGDQETWEYQDPKLIKLGAGTSPSRHMKHLDIGEATVARESMEKFTCRDSRKGPRSRRVDLKRFEEHERAMWAVCPFNAFTGFHTFSIGFSLSPFPLVSSIFPLRLLSPWAFQRIAKACA